MSLSTQPGSKAFTRIDLADISRQRALVKPECPSISLFLCLFFFYNVLMFFFSFRCTRLGIYRDGSVNENETWD